MGRIRCVLGDRSVFFTEGLRAILRQSPVATIIGTTQSPEDVPGLVRRTQPDVVLVSRLDGHRPPGHRLHDPVTLTQRERDIVQLIVDGHSNKALAAALGIAHQTAKNHVRHVMAKLRVSSRVQLVAWALERGYIPTETAATA